VDSDTLFPQMSELLNQGLRDLPIGVFIVSLDGRLEDLNEVASNLFRVVISVGEYIKEKLIDIDGSPLDVINKDEGYIRFGQIVFRFVCGRTSLRGVTYCNVCLFDHTEPFKKFENAETLRKIMNAESVSAASSSSEPVKIHESMSDFELKCSIDAGFGFSEDANATSESSHLFLLLYM
jgi:hypothetical protein